MSEPNYKIYSTSGDGGDNRETPHKNLYERIKDVIGEPANDLRPLEGRPHLQRQRRNLYYRRRYFGVADECCTYGCAYSDIILYCA